MANKIKISCDSICDLSPELVERYSVSVNPLVIVMDGKPYIDGVEITPDDIYDYYAKTGKLTQTTARNIDEYMTFFEPFAKEYDAVIHFTISSTMSSSYNNARLAAAEFNNVYVVDSKNLSTGAGLLVMKAAEFVEEGLKAEEILEKLSDIIDRVDASFVVDNLEFLHKGGRCSAVAALGANLLKLKPCIEVKEGKMGVAKKYRGKFGDTLVEYTKERLQDANALDLDHVFVTHAGCEEEIVNRVVECVKECANFKNLYITRAGSTVSTHCGRNTLGVLFIRK